MNDQKNTILAIVLSAIVLIGWQYFIGMPQLEKQKQEQQQQQQAPSRPRRSRDRPRSRRCAPGARPVRRRSPRRTGQPGGADRRAADDARGRARRLARASPIETAQHRRARSRSRAAASTTSSLVKFRETVDPKSPPIVLLSPSGSPEPFYAEFGWTGAAGTNVKLPTADTVWTQARLRRARPPAIR